MTMTLEDVNQKPPNPPQMIWAAVGLSAFLFIVSLFIFSRISASDLQRFQQNLENGNVLILSSMNPYRSVRAKAAVSGYQRFRAVLDQPPVRLPDLTAAYPDAVKYLAYHPNDAEALADLALYYFLSGKNLTAETLALKAVSMDPFNRRVRLEACRCQAYSFTDRERMMASTWDLWFAERNFVRSMKDVPQKVQFAYQLLWKLRTLNDKRNYHFGPEDFRYKPEANQARLDQLDAEGDAIAPQYAFSLFLTDPSRWASDTLDVLDEKALKDPENLEAQFVAAEWSGNTTLADSAYQAFLQKCPQDPEAKKRMDGFKAVYDVSPNEDQKMAGLNVYAPTHPTDNQWMAREQGGLNQFKSDYTISSPEPEGTGGDDLDALRKVIDGVNSVGPDETKADYDYPQPAENELTIDQLFAQAKPLPTCPYVCPLTDEAGKPTRLGAYLSMLSMIRASYLPDSALRVESPLQDFEWRGGCGLIADDKMLRGYAAQMGATSQCAGSLVPRESGYEVSVTFTGDFPTAFYSKSFKKNKLHLIPNWIADRTHHWMGTKLSRSQKKELKKPVFTDDDSLNRSLDLETYASWHTVDAPPWDGVFARNPQSSLVLSIYYYNQKQILGISDPKPLEAFLAKHPQDDMIKILLASFYSDKMMYGKALKIYFDVLSRDPTKTDLYNSVKYCLSRIGDWKAVRHFYETAAQTFPQSGPVQLAAGIFFKDYAWVARGDDWGYKVTPWNAELMQRRLELAKKYDEKSEALNPDDTRAEAGLLTVGMGIQAPQTEMDQIFNQGVSQDTGLTDLFVNRLEYLKPKWGGSVAQMMGFARQWESIHPRLMIDALGEKTQEYIGRTNDDKKAYYQYMGGQEVWPEMKKAYERMLTLFPDNFEMWAEYAGSAANGNHVEDFLDFLRAQAKTDDTVQMVLPYLVINVYTYRAEAIGWDEPGEVYLNSQKVWNDYYDAIMTAMKQDPDNYGFLNDQAESCVGWNRYELARVIFKQIGDHWTPSLWSKDKFDQFKAVAFGQAHPTWHVCTKPVNAADEHY